MLVSIAGCAGAYPIATGMTYRLRDQLQAAGCKDVHYAAISGGLVPALYAVLGVSAEDARKEFIIHAETMAKKVLYYPSYRAYIREWIGRHLQPSDLERLNGRLHIGVTEITLRGPRLRVFSRFDSLEDFTAIATAALAFFPFCPYPWYRVRGRICTDGEIMTHYLTLPGYTSTCVVDALTLRPSPLDFLPTRSLVEYDRRFEFGRRTEPNDSCLYYLLSRFFIILYALSPGLLLLGLVVFRTL